MEFIRSKMKLILIIVFITLASEHVSLHNGYSFLSKVMKLPTGQYICPSVRRISPEISLSPFEVLSDSPNQVRKEPPLTIIPVSIKAFAKLGMAVLPTNEICVLGQKLPGVVLPNDPTTQFEMMTGIGIWFSPCIIRDTHQKRKSCFRRQMNKFNEMDIGQVKSFHGLISRLLKLI